MLDKMFINTFLSAFVENDECHHYFYFSEEEDLSGNKNKKIGAGRILSWGISLLMFLNHSKKRSCIGQYNLSRIEPILLSESILVVPPWGIGMVLLML